MTEQEYTERRAKILRQIASPQSLTSGDRGIVNRPIRDLQMALGVLDAEWQAQTKTSSRIGRIYTGEGL